MKTAARSAASTVVSLLTAAGFKSHVPTGRGRRPGYTVHGKSHLIPTLAVFDHCGPVEFARICDTLVAAGYTLTDAQGGQNHVAYGCARLTPPVA